ncbi:TPA: hypothetical protein ACQVKY_005319, partial [Serratia marcescens]
MSAFATPISKDIIINSKYRIAHLLCFYFFQCMSFTYTKNKREIKSIENKKPLYSYRGFFNNGVGNHEINNSDSSQIPNQNHLSRELEKEKAPL